MNFTNNIIATVFLLCFIAYSGYSQQSNNNQLLEKAKKESEKISEQLGINDDQQVLLYRAIYTYKKGKAKINSVDDISESEKEDYLQKMESSFDSNVKHALGGNEELKQEFFTYYEKL
jgi:hypothetical protein